MECMEAYRIPNEVPSVHGILYAVNRQVGHEKELSSGLHKMQ